MFYYWFLDKFKLMTDLDTSPPISVWKVTDITKEIYIEGFVRIMKGYKMGV